MLPCKSLISFHIRNIFRRFSCLLVFVRYCLPFLPVQCCKLNVTVSFFNLLLYSPFHWSVGFGQQINILQYTFVLNLCCYVYQIQSQFRFWFRRWRCSWPVQTDTNGVSVYFPESSTFTSLKSAAYHWWSKNFTGLKVGRKTWTFFSSSCGKITWPKIFHKYVSESNFFCIINRKSVSLCNINYI